MSKTIDERVVQMRFDNKQFESGVQTTLSTLDKLKQSLKLTDASKGIENVTAAVKNCDMSPMARAAETISVKFSAMEAIAFTALQNITNSAIRFGSQIVSALTVDPIKTGLQEYETKINAIQVIQANTRGKNTMGEITAALDELNTYADKTIYNFAQMTSNIGKFTAQGLDVNEATKAVQGMANLAAASGASAEDMSRATYQMSQALSGTIRKIDWNSLRNANMATQTLKDLLIDIAKVEEGLDVNAMIADKGTFEDTLELGWLSGDLFTEAMNMYSGVYSEAELIAKGYSEEQIKNFMDIAATAESAATEVKTVTQLFDVLKETAQSGWTQTWEYVVGDFESAKKTLTQAQVYLSDMINASADARNAVMEAWSEAGGRDDLIQALVNAFQALLSFATPIKEAFNEIFPPMTAERLVGMTAALKEFTAKLQIGGTTANNLKRTFKGVFALFDIGLQLFKALGGGFADLVGYFLPAGDGLLDMTGNMGDFLVGVSEAIKTTDIFGESVKRITDSIKIFADFLGSFVSDAMVSYAEGGEGMAGAFEVAFDKMASVVSMFLDIVSTLTGKDLSEVKNNIVGFIQDIRDHVVGFIYEIQQNFDFHPFELLHDILARVQERMAQVGAVAGEMQGGFIGAVAAMGSALANCKFFEALGALWNGVKTIIGGILSVLGDFAGGIAEKIGNADFNGVFDIINSLLAGGIGVGIYKFIDTLNDVSEIAGGFKESLLDILGGVKDCLTEYQNSIKAKTLMTIAGAIGILAAALVVLSLIDSEKLSASLGAMTVMFADLVGGMAILGKTNAIDGVGKITTAMVGISVSVLILASALKKIGSLNFGEMMTGLVGVVGLTAMVTGAMILLSKFAQNGIKGAAQMVILAAALKILSNVLIDISSLNLTELGKGLLGVLGLMGTLVGAMVLLSKFAQNGVKGATSMVILSAAVAILATVLKDIGTLDMATIGKGLLGVVSLMGTLVGAMVLVSKFAKDGVKGATSMVIISSAIVILSNVLKDLGTLDLATIGKGLLGIVGLMGSMVGAMVLLSKFATNAASMLAAGAAMVLVAASITILADVLAKFGNMNIETLLQGLIGIGVLLLEISLMLNTMTGCLGGAAALLVVSAALMALTPVLSILGAMPLESIIKALGTLAGVFIILGVAGAALSGLVPSILGLAGAIALIGVGIVGFGAGMLLIGVGLSAIATGLTALAIAVTGGATAIVAGLTVIITGIAALIPAVAAKLGEAIIAFCKVIIDGAPAIGEAAVVLVHTLIGVLVECVPALAEGLLSLVVGVLDAMVTYGPQIVEAIMLFIIGILNELAKNIPTLIVAAVDVLMAFFQGVVDALAGIDTDTLLKGIVGVGILAAVMTALAAVATLVPGAMVGVLGMGAVIAELALVLAAVGALAQLPGLAWLVGEGGDFMQLVGNAIGQFVGGIVGGIMEGVSSSLPAIGTDLSTFMTNIQPFIDGAKAIDPTMLEGVNALAQTILILTAANLLEGLTSWLTGGSSMATFAAELVPFGESMKAYANAIAGIDANLVAESATAALALAEFASKLPNSGGLIAEFTGENSLAAFAEELVPFGASMKEYSEAIKGIDAEAVTASATAAMSLAELASKLPNSGGLAGWFAGENDMTAFGEQLVPFGEALKSYSLSVAGLDSNAITNSTVAAQSLAELANNLPNSGGLVSWFTGDNDMATFGASLVSFGENFAAYSDYMKNVDSGIVTTTTNAASSIVELQNSLPKEGGWFSDDMTLSDFGSDMSTFGSYFASYYSYISGIDAAHLSSIILETGNLVALANDMNALDTTGMSGFGEALLTLGNTGITEFMNAFTNSSEQVTTAVTTMMGYVSSAITANQPTCVTNMTTLANSLVTQLSNKYVTMYTVGSTMFTYLINGMKLKDPTVKATCTTTISGAITAIKNKYTDFYNAGAYLVSGFVNGIADNIQSAANKAAEMAKAASDAAKKELDINSPSRVGYSIGNFFGVGFVNAIAAYGKKAYDTSRNMASMAKSGLSAAVSSIADWIDSDMDTQPTIRPVLDLSGVEKEAMRLDTMFSHSQAIAAGSGITSRRTNSNDENQNGVNGSKTGNTFTFTQNNYSPKALSRIEIYRQTKNQFSAMKEALT